MTDSRATVESLCKQLADEPLFHMSLGSKELFHSNFIAWFCDQFPDAGARVFGSWGDPRPGATHQKTLREWQHLDLVLHLPGLGPIVIENKVFSVPDPRQLEEYSGKVPGGSENLLTLVRSEVEVSGWKLRSYDDLADLLARELEAEGCLDPFSRDVVAHYVDMVRTLSDLMDIVGSPAPDEPIAVAPPILKSLRDLRLDAGVQKARFARVAQDLRNAASQRGWNAPVVDIHSGLTRTMGLVAAFMWVGPDALGWQVQGNQFRLAIKVGKGRPRPKREEYIRQTYPEWFDFAILNEFVPETAAQLPRPYGADRFNGYEPDFVYRYQVPSALTAAEVLNVGMRYLERAADFGGRL